MELLCELLFGGLLDAAQAAKLPRTARIASVILVSLVFLLAVISLGLVALNGAEQSLFKRVLCLILALLFLLYYVHLFRAVRRA